LGAKNVFGYAATERGAQAFTFRPLHQDHEHHEQGVKNEDAFQDIDQKVHWDGQYP
jgi:hypothetical protein